MTKPALLDPENDPFDPNAHWECFRGKCGHCGGRGERDCECPECQGDYKATCQHCDGTGNCRYDGTLLHERQKQAKHEWEAFRNEWAFKPTKDEFIRAHTQMFGRAPSDDVSATWDQEVQRMAKRAGVTR